MKRHRSYIALLLVLTLVYFCAGKLGLSLAFIHASATAVWPPTGIALVAVLFWGYRVWPALFVAAFFVNLTTEGTVLTSVGIALGNTLEALLGAWLVKRYAQGREAFKQIPTIFRFVFLAGVVSTAMSATIGVFSLCLGGFADRANYSPIWLTWWIGDMVSDIIIAPLLLIWVARHGAQWKLSRVPEALLLAAAVFLAGQFVFGGWVMPRGTIYAIEYLALLPLLWAAWRFGQRGASLAALGISIIAIKGTLHGCGPFATADNNESLLLLQTFMATITLTALILASVVVQRNRAFEALQAAQAQLSNHAVELEKQVAERTGELQASVKSLEGFCYSMAHDLRGPVRYINGFSKLLTEDCASTLDAKARDYARRISEASERMDKLIWDLLEFGRLNSTDMRLEIVDTDIIVRNAIQLMRKEYSGAVVEVRGTLPPVLANPAVLEQITVNLLRNAATFVSPGVAPQIQAGAEDEAGQIRIWIKDNGIGIDPVYHEKIFGVFQRLHSNRAYPGTGIGLAIVKTAVERMGGRVGLESGLGRGSYFWFELKAAEKTGFKIPNEVSR